MKNEFLCGKRQASTCGCYETEKKENHIKIMKRRKNPREKNHIVWLEQKKNLIQKLSQKWCLLFTISS